jgi:hypothetical protein
MVQYYFDEYYYPDNPQYCKKYIRLIFYFSDICYFSNLFQQSQYFSDIC